MVLDLEKTLGFALHHSSFLFKTGIKSAITSVGLDITPEEFVLIFMIPESGIEKSELCRKTRKDKTNITRLISRVVDKGYASRRVSENRRHQTIYLTKQGAKLQQQLEPVLASLAASATEGISPAALEITRKTLNRLSENLHA